MKNYYSTLELSKDASVGEIKKAYFAFVRKYPPDRYPEEFMKIREAYEVLSDESTREQYDKVSSMPEIVNKFFEEGKEALEMGDYSRAIGLLERVTELYPGFSVVEGLLGDAYKANGNSGKAIKVFEGLVKKEPQNAGYAGKLAMIYHDRGWRKKAVKQYKIALKLDEDNISLWAGLVECLSKGNKYKEAEAFINKALERSKDKGWDNLGLYYLLIQIDIVLGRVEDLDKHIEEMKEKAKENDVEKSNVGWFFAHIAVGLESMRMNKLAERFINAAVELDPENEEIKRISSDNGEYQSLLELNDDESVDIIFDDLFELEISQCDCDDCKMAKFEIEMTIISEIDLYREDLIHIRKYYPELYKLKGDFFNKVLDEKKYVKLAEEYIVKIRKYNKLFPDYFEDELFEENEPVVREGRKIGRNEPCPCGSGKKYKKCCGK